MSCQKLQNLKLAGCVTPAIFENAPFWAGHVNPRPCSASACGARSSGRHWGCPAVHSGCAGARGVRVDRRGRPVACRIRGGRAVCSHRPSKLHRRAMRNTSGGTALRVTCCAVWGGGPSCTQRSRSRGQCAAHCMLGSTWPRVTCCVTLRHFREGSLHVLRLQCRGHGEQPPRRTCSR